MRRTLLNRFHPGGPVPAGLILTFAVAAAALTTAAGRAGEKKPALDLGAGEKADDLVRRGLLAGPEIPTTIFEVRRHLEKKLGGKLRSHIVANGGHEHPTKRGVLFMCFETYSGPRPGGGNAEEDELFLGFFIGPDDKTLAVRSGFIELIAWDRTKKAYNFWEVIGRTWHYRGDSRDVLEDGASINVGAKAPAFAGRLRCSGCHTLGGPIMKEIEPPHNDWWTAKHGLETKPWRLEEGADRGDPKQLAGHLFRSASDASNLSKQVKRGIDRLVAGGVLWGRGLRQQLRSLFTTMEMNFVSDTVPFKERVRKGEMVEIPQDFFIDARLVGGRQPVKVELKRYRDALLAVGSRFPPPSAAPGTEARHAFLVPGRSYVDNRLIEALVARGVLDEELVAAVLAVDLTTPVYSRPRAALIRLVPEDAKDMKAKDLRDRLVKALREAPAKDRAAQELLRNLTDPQRTAAVHRKAALAYLEACGKAANGEKAATDWLRLASQRRAEVLDAETARNEQGNILEKGFRLAFPSDGFDPVPGRLRLDPASGLSRQD